jgi:hypothetical protein
MEVHATHTPPTPIVIGQEKMDTLSLGVFNVIPRCILWFYGRKFQRT